MSHRSTMLGLALIAGTAGALPAQSSELPFRRFGSWGALRFDRDVRPLRFSFDNSARLRLNADRIRQLAPARASDLAARARNRAFFQRDLDLRARTRALYQRDLEMRARNRAFALRDQASRRQLELRFRTMDRSNQRLDRFRTRRPIVTRRHSRPI